MKLKESKKLNNLLEKLEKKEEDCFAVENSKVAEVKFYYDNGDDFYDLEEGIELAQKAFSQKKDIFRIDGNHTTIYCIGSEEEIISKLKEELKK